MKGFTLIETLIYMAVSSMIAAALVSFSIMLADAERAMQIRLKNESDGITVLKTAEYLLLERKPIDLKNIAPDLNFENISVTTETNLKSVSFEINSQEFSLTLYVPD